MKKLILITLLSSLLSTTLVHGNTSIPVYFGDIKLNLSAEPVMRNGTVLVPFRDIFETLGYSVYYDGSSNTIESKKDGSEITLFIGSTYANVSGKDKYLSEAPEIINGTTMVPLRFVSESAGYTVEWHSKDNSNYITIDNFDKDSVVNTSEYEQKQAIQAVVDAHNKAEQERIDKETAEREKFQQYIDERSAILRDFDSKWISDDHLISLHHVYASWMGETIVFQKGSSTDIIFQIDGSPKKEFIEGRIYEGNGVRYQYIKTITYPFPNNIDGSGVLEIKVNSIVYSVPDLKAKGIIK